jgi:hypothetical protein
MSESGYNQAAELDFELIELDDSTTGEDELIELDSTMGRELEHERTALLIGMAGDFMQLAVKEGAELNAAVAKIQTFEAALARGMPPVAKSKQRRRGTGKDPQTERRRRAIRRLRAEGNKQLIICRWLDDNGYPTPKTWGSRWVKAYQSREHGQACRTLISKDSRTI